MDLSTIFVCAYSSISNCCHASAQIGLQKGTKGQYNSHDQRTCQNAHTCILSTWALCMELPGCSYGIVTWRTSYLQNKHWTSLLTRLLLLMILCKSQKSKDLLLNFTSKARQSRFLVSHQPLSKFWGGQVVIICYWLCWSDFFPWQNTTENHTCKKNKAFQNHVQIRGRGTSKGL